MNSTEISNLTDAELDRLCATTVMRWRCGSGLLADCYFRERWEMVCRADDWHPSTDWGDAGKVVERMRRLREPWKLTVGENDGDCWQAVFVNQQNGRVAQADADTAPRAIVRAAVLACQRGGE